MAIELKDITSKWMYISITELKESGFWTKDFEDNPQTYSDEWIKKAINLSSVKINDWTGGYIGYADNIDNLTEEQQIGVKWATAIYTLHWLSKGTEYLLQATTFSQGSQSYNIDVPQDMQFVPDEVQKILINAGLYENIRFANLKEKDKSCFSSNGWRYEFDEGSGYASYDWVRNNYISNNNIISSDNSILISFLKQNDAMPKKLDLKVNPNIKTKVDNRSIVYNSNNELSVPFDNKTIIKNEHNEIAVSDLKQDKLISGENIKTINGNSLLGSGNISISSGNDWELINYPEANEKLTFKIPNYDLTKYFYKISISITDYSSANKFVTYYFETISQKSIFSFLADNSYKRITIKQDGSISNDTNNIVIKDLTIKRKLINNNRELMADEPHSVYKRDMDTDLPKYQEETSDSSDIVIRKINSATTINELNLLEKHPVWRIISNNRNDIKELFNKKWIELNKNE